MLAITVSNNVLSQAQPQSAVPNKLADIPGWLAVGLIWLVWKIPFRVRNAIAIAVARLLVRRRSSTRRAIEINIQACFPELTGVQRRALFFEYTLTQLQAALSQPRQWWGSDQQILEKARLHNRHIMDAAMQSGQPVVLLVTHSVALDAGLMAVAPHFPLQGIYNPFRNRVLDWLVFRSRNRFGALPVSRGNGFRTMIKGLQQGRVLCYLSDEDLGPKGSVFAPFFGHQKATLAMLPRIVRKTGAKVVPMIAHYDASTDGVDVHFFAPLEQYPSGDDVADAANMNAAIENTVRLQPAQFFWKMRMFKTCPDGGGTRYGQIERGEMSVTDL